MQHQDTPAVICTSCMATTSQNNLCSARRKVWYAESAHVLGVLLTATTLCQPFFGKNNEQLVHVTGFKISATSQSETCPDVLRFRLIAIVGIWLSELIRKPRPQLSCGGLAVFPFWCCPEELQAKQFA